MKLFNVFMVALLLSFYGCGGGGSSSDDSDSGGTGGAPTDSSKAPVSVKVQANYGSSSKGRSAIPIIFNSCNNPNAKTDSITYAEGLDCDKDGGVIKYIDPSSFSIAIKRLAFKTSKGEMIDLIADKGSLKDSEVLNLQHPVELSVDSVPVADYTSVYAEFYYYDLTMKLYSSDKQIRIYLSDDNFPSEGNLGHHQGDVLLLADAPSQSGVKAGEYGFVLPGQQWISQLLVPKRSGDFNGDGNANEFIKGASSADSETGHERGLYGDDTMWNASNFKQGANQDIFILDSILPEIKVEPTGGTFTISFDLNDTWFFEDFNGNGVFEPCIADEACADGSEWTPVLPGVSVDFK